MKSRTHGALRHIVGFHRSARHYPGWIATPNQLCKSIWGLRADIAPGATELADGSRMTLVHSDPTLMNMDAPEVIPSGACYGVDVGGPELVYVSERCELREEWRYREVRELYRKP